MRPPALVLLLSPTLRQSGELLREKVLWLWKRLGQPGRLRQPTALSVELAGGSRIVSLPESEEGIRGFSNVALLVLDEAARIADPLYRAVRPMLAVSGGRIVALSTPFGRRGWFYEAWTEGVDWRRVRTPASACPRISAEFLATERQALGERWFRQEFECSFEAAEGQVFDAEQIRRAVRSDVQPLFQSSHP
jgi:hypothetical protein